MKFHSKKLLFPNHEPDKSFQRGNNKVREGWFWYCRIEMHRILKLPVEAQVLFKVRRMK